MEKRIYITGAGSGLGLEISKIFKKNSFNITTHKHKCDDSNQTNITYGDISELSVQTEILNHFINSNSNVLINNVGIYISKPFLNFTDEEIVRILNTNLTSTILLTRKILEHLVNIDGGMIYNINSVAGIKPSVFESIYCASKFGLRGFTESLIKEYKNNKKIRIVNVTLGAFKSKITKERDNFEELAEPTEIAHKIYNHILEDYQSIETELCIYKKIRYGTDYGF